MSRTLVKRWFLIWPVVAMFLLNLSLPALWRMDCLSSGKVKLAWVSIKPCCHEDHRSDGPSLYNHCCDYRSVHAEIQDLIRASEPWLALHVVEAGPAIATDAVVPSAVVAHAFTGPGPPVAPSALDHLVQLSTLRL